MTRKKYHFFYAVLTVCFVLSLSASEGKKEAVGLILVVSNSSKYNSVDSVEAVYEGIKNVNENSGLVKEYQLEIIDEIVPQVCFLCGISCEVQWSV